MKPGPDSATIYRIARYYYEEGLSQDEIAGREGFSRSQISRLLDKAKDMGLVRIQLVPPSELRAEEYAAAIERGYGLKKVIVAPQGGTKAADGVAVARSIATAAAAYLSEALLGHKVIGIGWGRTVYAVSEQLPYREIGDEKRFVPLVGISGDDNPVLQINTIIDRLGSRFKSRGLFVNTPAVRERASTLTRIEQERVANLVELWKAVDIAVIGLGDPPSPSSRFLEELPASYREGLCASGAVGDILGQFFHADGSVVEIGADYEMLAFDIRRLPSLARVICLAGGTQKSEGIAAAAASGYISELVTDEATARKLFERL